MVTHFNNAQLQFTADDPPPRRESKRRIDIPLTREKLLHAYYRPFKTWLAEDPRAYENEIDGVMYRLAPVDAADLTVGVSTEVIAADLPRAREAAIVEGQRYYSGRDGVIVIPGPVWSDENMKREPQERRSPR